MAKRLALTMTICASLGLAESALPRERPRPSPTLSPEQARPEYWSSGHDVDPLDYLANHETWNLINRNMQLIVSGLYYWTVEDDAGNTQIGKLVVIM